MQLANIASRITPNLPLWMVRSPSLVARTWRQLYRLPLRIWRRL
jgi:hypothetical protein